MRGSTLPLFLALSSTAAAQALPLPRSEIRRGEVTVEGNAGTGINLKPFDTPDEDEVEEMADLPAGTQIREIDFDTPSHTFLFGALGQAMYGITDRIAVRGQILWITANTRGDFRGTADVPFFGNQPFEGTFEFDYEEVSFLATAAYQVVSAPSETIRNVCVFAGLGYRTSTTKQSGDVQAPSFGFSDTFSETDTESALLLQGGVMMGVGLSRRWELQVFGAVEPVFWKEDPETKIHVGGRLAWQFAGGWFLVGTLGGTFNANLNDWLFGALGVSTSFGRARSAR